RRTGDAGQGDRNSCKQCLYSLSHPISKHLHGEPGVEEQGVVVLGANRRAVEFVVISILQAEPRIEPRPARRLAHTERNVGDLGGKAAAVGTKVGAAGVQYYVGSAPDVEILPREYDSIVAAVGERRLQAHGIQEVRRIGGAHSGESSVESLKFSNEASPQSEPIIITLVLILGVKANIGEFVRLWDGCGECGIPWIDVGLHAK